MVSQGIHNINSAINFLWKFGKVFDWLNVSKLKKNKALENQFWNLTEAPMIGNLKYVFFHECNTPQQCQSKSYSKIVRVLLI